MSPRVSKCPQCGAPLQAPPGAISTQCMYCKSLVALDAPPAPPPPPRIMAQPPAGAAVGVTVAVGAVVAIAGVVGSVFAFRTGSSSGIGGAIGAHVQWEGVHGAIFADVNHDGTQDIVGRLRQVVPTDEVWLGAFDGRNGAELWKGAALGTYTETYQGTLALAGDTLLFASPGGQLSGYSVRDGKRTWQSSLPEKVAQVCAGATDTVRIVLQNKQEVTLRIADGRPAPPDKGAGGACRRVAFDGKWGDPSFEVVEEHPFKSDVPGLRADFTLQRAGGPKVLFGVRSEGTSVPMIGVAYASDPTRNWKSDLAGSRPLETGPFGPEAAAITDAAAYTVYAFTDIQKPKVLVAFDLSGQRQWEAPLPNTAPLSAVQASGGHVFVTQWGRIQAYDAKTGKQAFAIGSGFP